MCFTGELKWAFTQQCRVTRDVRARALVLVGLAVLGVGLALSGSAIGVGSETLRGEGPAVTVDDDVSVSEGADEVVVVENVSTIDSVAVEASDGGTIRFETEPRRGLSADARARGEAIARDNATVARALASLSDPRVSVEPVVRLDADAVRSVDVTGSGDGAVTTDGPGETVTFTVNATTVEEEPDTVVVDRKPAHVPDRASVRIRDGQEGHVRYSATVDLENETVTGLTDRGAIGGESGAGQSASGDNQSG